MCADKVVNIGPFYTYSGNTSERGLACVEIPYERSYDIKLY